MKPRLVLLALLIVALALGAWATGLHETWTTARLQASVAEAGAWGLLLFFAAFTAGQLLQVPGVVFILAARAAWGPVAGFTTAYAGAVLSATLVFLIVRAVGGTPLAEVRWAPARRLLAGLDRRPVATIAALRALLMLAPPLNYALALSPVRPGQHLLGSALGLLVPVSAVVFLSEGALALLGR